MKAGTHTSSLSPRLKMASSSPSPSPSSSGCSPPSSSSSNPPSSTSSLKSLPKNAYWDASKNSEPACPSPVVSFHYKLILSLPQLLTKKTPPQSNLQYLTRTFTCFTLENHRVARIETIKNPKKKKTSFPLHCFSPSLFIPNLPFCLPFSWLHTYTSKTPYVDMDNHMLYIGKP